jgi:hypothetical protein
MSAFHQYGGVPARSVCLAALGSDGRPIRAFEVKNGAPSCVGRSWPSGLSCTMDIARGPFDCAGIRPIRQTSCDCAQGRQSRRSSRHAGEAGQRGIVFTLMLELFSAGPALRREEIRILNRRTRRARGPEVVAEPRPLNCSGMMSRGGRENRSRASRGFPSLSQATHRSRAARRTAFRKDLSPSRSLRASVQSLMVF